MQVLLIDDNRLMQQVISRYLGTLGHKVTIAGSGGEAIAAAQEQAFDLFFVDMHLPDMDGQEALLIIRTMPGCAAIPAIALSGLDEEELRATLGNEFSGYLLKPVELDALEQTVRRFVTSTRTVGT